MVLYPLNFTGSLFFLILTMYLFNFLSPFLKVEQNLFLIELSSLEGRQVAITDHLFPTSSNKYYVQCVTQTKVPIKTLTIDFFLMSFTITIQQSNQLRLIGVEKRKTQFDLKSVLFQERQYISERIMKNKVNNKKHQQLQAKLHVIKNIQELKNIYRGVEQQNTTLREDVLALKYKVDLLIKKQNTQNSYVSKDDQLKSKQLHMFQDELKQQYKIMNQLKKRKQHSLSQKASEEINEQLLSYTNKLKKLQSELNESKIEVSDLKREQKRLSKTIASLQQQEKKNEPNVIKYNAENYELKKKVLSLRKLQTQKQYQSAKIMNSMYTVKTKYKNNQSLEQQYENKKLTNTKQKLKIKSNSQTIDINALTKQVLDLKKQKHKIQKQLTVNQSIALKKKQEYLNTNKELVTQLKQWGEKKMKTQRELNKYKNIWSKYLEFKNNSSNAKEFIAQSQQTQQFVFQQEPLRRDYAGVLGGKFSFDDRTALKNNTKSYMIGFMVYQLDQTAATKHQLVALRVIYDDVQASTLNDIPIPSSVLAKCKLIKYMLMQGDFIKLFKVKYHASDSRIIKIQIRTNKNSRYQFGDKRPFTDLASGQNVYGFDISVQEYPVCLFGTYNNVRSQWYMESLGVEINDLNNINLNQSFRQPKQIKQIVK